MSEQPMPTPGREGVFDALYASLRAREQQGWRTYGRPLETHNGRDALRDWFEEQLDAMVYAKQYIMEQEWEISQLKALYVQIAASQSRGEACTAASVTLLASILERKPAPDAIANSSHGQAPS